MRRLVPPHLEGWQPDAPATDSRSEEHHLFADGAVLLLDAEGSTELSARRRARGTLGAEPLDLLLDQIFARAVDVVVDFGGYVGHFTGDGVIAAFPGARAEAVSNAIVAAQIILEHFAQLSGIVTAAGTVELAVRAVVGAGTIDTYVWRARSISRSDKQNATYVIVGSALTEAQVGERLIGGGALGVGPTAAAAFPDGPYVALSDGATSTHGAEVGDGAGGYVEVDLTQPSRHTADGRVALEHDSAVSPLIHGDWRFVTPEAFTKSVEPEFRHACVLFLELREWPQDHTVATILEQAAATGGHVSNVLRTSAAQRGLTIMLVWGAPKGHADDASRALEFVEAVQQLIGIYEFKTGAVYSAIFIGFVGSDARSTYTVIGAPVNLAARLCSLAGWGEIRVTEVFDDLVPWHWAVEPVEATLYKGFSEPLVTRSLRPTGGPPPTPANA